MRQARKQKVNLSMKNNKQRMSSILREAYKLAKRLEEEYKDPSKINDRFLSESKNISRGDFHPEFNYWFEKRKTPRIAFNFSTKSPWRAHPQQVLPRIASKYNLDVVSDNNFYTLTERSGKSICEVFLYTIWIDPTVDHADKLLHEIAYEAFRAKEK